MSKVSPAQLWQAAAAAGFDTSNNRRTGLFSAGPDATIAAAIAVAESGGDTGATHKNTDGSTDYGAWQINSAHTEYAAKFADGSWADLATNAGMAYGVFTWQGFKAWSAYNSQRNNPLSAFNQAMVSLNALDLVAGSPGTAAGAAGAVTGAASGTADAVAQAGHALAFLSTPDGWVRAAKVVAGVGLILIGVAAILRPAAAGAAGTVAPAARAARTVAGVVK